MPALVLDDIENIVLDLVFRGNARNFQPPTSLYIGLLGTNGLEITGGSYARVNFASSAANWGIGSEDGGITQYGAVNLAYIRWANLGLNVTIAGIAVYAASTGGNMLFGAKLPSNYVATTGDAYGPQIYANDLGISLYGAGYKTYPFTQFLISRLSEYIFMGNPSGWAPPSNLYLGLLTGDVTNNIFTEVSKLGTGYDRIELASNATTWKSTQNDNAGNSTGAGGIIKNSARIDWDTVTGTYGLVRGLGLFDSATDGNLLWVMPLTTNVRVDLGDEPPYILAGNLQVSAMSSGVTI
jgi:hypothetical protein